MRFQVGLQLLESNSANVSGNCFYLASESDHYWNLVSNFPENIALAKGQWKSCLIGDHATLLLDHDNKLFELNIIKSGHYSTAIPKFIEPGNIILIDYCCKLLAYVSKQEQQLQFVIVDTNDFGPIYSSPLTKSVLKLSCGKDHVIFLDESRSVYTCGSNSRGQLGCGSDLMRESKQPRRVDMLLGMVIDKISAGGWHNLVYDAESNCLLSWGWNESGQLGHQLRGDLPNLVDLTDDDSVNLKVAKIGCGSRHTIVLLCNGTLFAFGCNDFGQLGGGTADGGERPVIVMDGVHDAFAFSYATCVVLAHGHEH